MEIEKKKTRPTKRSYAGPVIRYHSLSMPLIDELPEKQTRQSSNKSTTEDRHNISGIAKLEDDENE